jgi:thiosulfate/3-mercaptopyruvate sulfurtransferase
MQNIMRSIVSVDFLSELNPENYRIIDCRFSLVDAEYGRHAYEQDHIPNAIYASLNKDLSSKVVKGITGRHPLPKPSEFENTVREWGINNNQLVVLYDDDVGSYAARAWWMLRWLGHDQVVVLKGGYKAWKKSGKEISQQVPVFVPSLFKRADPLTKQISADALVNYQSDIVDARDPRRFSGEVEPIDPVAGHIPGARCMPFMLNVDDEGEFKSVADLRRQFNEFGISDSQELVCYCGSGVTATHNILCLVQAGFPEPILYAGSWSEWITDPKREIALGNAAGK